MNGGREQTLRLEGLTPFCQTSGGHTRYANPELLPFCLLLKSKSVMQRRRGT